MKIIVAGIVMLFSFSTAIASNIALKLTNNDLKIKAELSFNESKPVVISGFDDSNKPYKLTIQTKPQGQKIVQTTYWLDRAGKVQSGSIVQEKGKVALIQSVPDDKKELGVTFEARITD